MVLVKDLVSNNFGPGMVGSKDLDCANNEKQDLFHLRTCSIEPFP